MTEDRLIELIATWGADPDAFPASERTAAKAMLAAQPDRFAAVMAEARALDAALSRIPEVTPSHTLTEALIASAPKPRASLFRLPRLAPWAPAGGFAALAAGLFMGVMVAPTASATSTTDDVAALLDQALGYDPVAITEEIAE